MYTPRRCPTWINSHGKNTFCLCLNLNTTSHLFKKKRVQISFFFKLVIGDSRGNDNCRPVICRVCVCAFFQNQTAAFLQNSIFIPRKIAFFCFSFCTCDGKIWSTQHGAFFASNMLRCQKACVIDVAWTNTQLHRNTICIDTCFLVLKIQQNANIQTTKRNMSDEANKKCKCTPQEMTLSHLNAFVLKNLSGMHALVKKHAHFCHNKCIQAFVCLAHLRHGQYLLIC